MRCPTCQFENVPGQIKCLKCGSVLDGKRVAVDVYPPRMATWKKPLRDVSRWIRRNRIIAGRGLALRRPSWTKIMSRGCFWGLCLSIVPGLAQLIEGRFREIIWYFLAWLLSLLVGLFLYGTGIGLFLTGLAIGLHAWIAIQHRLIKEVTDFGARIFCVILALVALTLIYRAVPRVLLPGLTGGHTSLTIPYHNIEAGDYLLARRSRTSAEPLARGSLVLARLATVVLGERSSGSRSAAPTIVQIVGLPGEHVQMENDIFIVNGQKLDSEKYPVPRWLRGRRISVNVGDDSYFISSQYDIYARGRQLTDANIHYICLIRSSNIEALAFMRWLPLSRRGFLREIE